MTKLRLALKRVLGTVGRLRRRPERRRILLLYHSIGGSPLASRVAEFRDQIAWLASEARILPLAELLSNTSSAALQVAITFDDGYASLYGEALPVLGDAGAVATAFLNTGWVGTGERMTSVATLGHYPNDRFLLWREVQALADHGWEIGSHGVEHLDLTRQPDAVVARELRDSRQVIEARIGACSPIYSYTWGRNTKRIRCMVEAAGYRGAVATTHAPLSDGDDPFAMPRMNIDARCSLADFKAIVRGDWDYLAWFQRTKAGLPRLRAPIRAAG